MHCFSLSSWEKARHALHCITGHEQTQYKLSLLFSFLDVVLASKGSN